MSPYGEIVLLSRNSHQTSLIFHHLLNCAFEGEPFGSIAFESTPREVQRRRLPALFLHCRPDEHLNQLKQVEVIERELP